MWLDATTKIILYLNAEFKQIKKIVSLGKHGSDNG